MCDSKHPLFLINALQKESELRIICNSHILQIANEVALKARHRIATGRVDLDKHKTAVVGEAMRSEEGSGEGHRAERFDGVGVELYGRKSQSIA